MARKTNKSKKTKITDHQFHCILKQRIFISGGDDGYLHIWDLRRFKEKAPVATFKHHTDSITTVEWHPTDSTVFASGGSDNQISLWDLSVEKDSESEQDEIKVYNHIYNKTTGIHKNLSFYFAGTAPSAAVHTSRADEH